MLIWNRAFAVKCRPGGRLVACVSTANGFIARPCGKSSSIRKRPGLDCLNGDRLIELGCVELLNHIPTGRTFHAYINPRRAVSADAVLVHGLTDEFLRDKPCFEAIAEDVLRLRRRQRAGGAQCELRPRLHQHGARAAARRRRIAEHRFVDTLLLARRRHPERPEQPRRALRPLRHRQQRPHQARRAARRGNPGGGLSRAARRPAGDLRARLRSRARAVGSGGDRRDRRRGRSRCRRGSRSRTSSPTGRSCPASVPSRCGIAIWRPSRRPQPPERRDCELSSAARRPAAARSARPCAAGRARRNPPGRSSAAESRPGAWRRR